LENKDLAKALEEKQAAEDGVAVAAAKKRVQPKASAATKAGKNSSSSKTLNKKRDASPSSSSATSTSYNISASGMETSDDDVPNKKHKKASDMSMAKRNKMKPMSPSSNSDNSARTTPSIVRRRRANIARNQDMERRLNLQGGLLSLPPTKKKQKHQPKMRKAQPLARTHTTRGQHASEDTKYGVERLLESTVRDGIKKMKVLWTTGETTWEPEIQLRKDIAQEVDAYYDQQRRHTMEALDSDEAVGEQHDNDAPRQAAANDPESVVQPCKHNHEDYTAFKAEDNPGYCKQGYMLYQVKCGVCCKEFVHVTPSDKSNTHYKPSRMDTVHLCPGYTQDCKYALCKPCYLKNLVTHESKGRRNTHSAPSKI